MILDKFAKLKRKVNIISYYYHGLLKNCFREVALCQSEVTSNIPGLQLKKFILVSVPFGNFPAIANCTIEITVIKLTNIINLKMWFV